MKMKTTLFSALFLTLMSQVYGQCDTTQVNGDMTVSSSTFLSGVYYVNGTFKVNSGVIVFVQTYGFNGCGKLEIHADNIQIDGTINGDYAGYSGGTGGAPGQDVSSLTGDAASLTGCSNKDNTGIVQLQGGLAGTSGMGPGAGFPGTDGGTGSGPKQQCMNTDDEPGMIGGSGGAGGGAGASYGGIGSSGGNGGSGSSTYSATGLNVSSAYPVVGGTSGSGGATATVYGTTSGQDTDLGSGGAGAGGGGRSFDTGLGGANGGAGGGLVLLYATNSLTISGTVTVNGEDGQDGGSGGNGGETAKCCSDGCDDCGEANLSTGAGAGAGAGAGSGGCIFLYAENAASITGTLEAKGGSGGSGGARGNGTSCTYSATFCGSQSLTSNNGEVGQSGGAGGGGRIKIFVPICSQATVTPTTALDGGTGFAAGTAGTYFLGCSELSVAEQTQQVSVQLFPNPAKDMLQVTLDGALNGANLTVLDVSGRVIYQTTIENTQNPIQIPVMQLGSGMYHVWVQSEGATISKRFIKN